HRGSLAKFPGRGAVRRPPPARRVGGLGSGAQGRPQCLLRVADPVGLRLLPGEAQLETIPGRVDGLRPESAVQAHAPHAPLRAAPSRLLAVAPAGAGTDTRPTDPGESPAVRAGRGTRPWYDAGAG